MRKIIVTGINGFVGHHVARVLSKKNCKVVGLGNQPKLSETLEGVVQEYFGLDLTDKEAVSGLDLSDADGIINLAGFAKVGDSKDQAELYNKVNVGVHITLYEMILRQNLSPKIVAVSTGAVYDPNQTLPITEDSKLIDNKKTNEYVISKKLMEESVLKLKERGLNLIVARPFNHTGPGQMPGFLLPDLAEQIKNSIKTGEPMLVGNLNTKRDFTDVRDVAKAYVDLVLCDDSSINHDIYNICSGKSISGKKILELLSGSMGVKNLKVEVDPSRLRKNEVMDIYGSFDRLKKDVDWQPTISIDQTIRDFVNLN